MKKSLFGAGRSGHDVNQRLRPASVRGSGQRGFTLVELLIAMALAALVSAAIYAMYMSSFQRQQNMDLTLEAEQNARAGAEVMERELQNAGYLAGTINAVTKASAINIEFIYTDPSDSSASATAADLLQVEYVYDPVALTVNRKVTNQTDVTVQTAELISDVKSFTITYYDTDGVAFVPADQAARNTIRYVDINMVTQTSVIPQGATVRSTFALTIHLKLRNIDIAQAATDATPPDAPTFAGGGSDGVRDPGRCGRLTIKWTPSTAGDVAGYKVYYGTTPGNYTGVISIPKDSLGDGSTFSCTAANGPCTLFSSLAPFTFSPSDSSTGPAVPYYFAMKSYDKSMNHSVYSAGITGGGGTDTLAGSNAFFGGGSDDTTVNPKKPGAVSGFIAANGDVDGKVNLSWSAYDTVAYPDVTALRIYRIPYDAATPYTYPILPANYIGMTTVASTSYSDSGGLTGCNTYRYAIAPVNCDLTLVSLDGGDVAGPTQDTTPYYESYDYSETYGDGVAGNAFTNIADSPGGSDTSPTDMTGPDAPIPFTVRAGYKRVAVNFVQPPASDVAQTCIYIAVGATAPDVDADPLSVDADHCSTLSLAPPASKLPENNGVFTKPPYTGSNSFWNNSASGAASSIPLLAESGTYSYTAIAYDVCGNRSAATSARDSTTLCGEDPGPPTGLATKPPAVTGVTVSGCGGAPEAMVVNWTPITSDLSLGSSFNNPFDLAGYRLFKSGTTDFSAGTLLNTLAPTWTPPYSDTTTTDGGVVYYRVYSSDCPFEKGDDTGGVYPTASQMLSNLSPSVDILPVYPAKLKREMKYPVAWTNHREVLTGVDLAVSGNSTPKSNYRHDTVTMFLYSTGHSASSMTITGMSLSWINSNAYLKTVKIGGGSSGVAETTVATLATSQSTAVTGNDPYSKAVSNISFGAGKVIPGGASSWNVPIKFYFTDSGGAAVSEMRNDQFLLTLNVKNNSTGTTTCLSYLTVSEAFTGTTVPIGPTVTSATQNQPTAPTFPYAVPGTTGLETVPVDGVTLGPIKVNGGSDVEVTATINPNTYDEVTGGTIPVTSATLYYGVSGITTGASPSFSTFTAVPMTNSSGNLWVGTIPAQDTSVSNKRVWYYVIGIDNDGNFDKMPSIKAVAYTYDQKAFYKCDYTPSAPTGLTSYSVSAGNVAFSWPRVTTYSNGTAISTGADPLYYRVYRKDSITGAYVKLYDVPDNTTGSWVLIPGSGAAPFSPATSSYYVCEPSWLPGQCIYWDYIDASLAGNDFSYYVKSKNSCGTDTNLSAATSPFKECQGVTTATLTMQTASPINVGDSYTITVDDCLMSADPAQNDWTAGNISSRGGVDLPKPLIETTTTSGSYTSTVLTQRIGAGDVSGVYVNPSDTIDDTVTVSCPGCTGSPTATITVKAVACDFDPAAPTALTGTTTKPAGNNKPCTSKLWWTASTSPDVTSYEIYKRTSPTAAFPAIPYATVGTGPWTSAAPYSDPVTYISTGANCVLVNYYYIKAVDSCSTGALKSAATPNTSPGYGPR